MAKRMRDNKSRFRMLPPAGAYIGVEALWKSIHVWLKEPAPYEQFQRAMADYLKSKWAVVTSSGRYGMTMVLKTMSKPRRIPRMINAVRCVTSPVPHLLAVLNSIRAHKNFASTASR